MKLPTVLYSKDIDKIIPDIIKTLTNDISELVEHIEKTPNIQLENLEVFVRNILNKSLSITIQGLKNQYGFKEKDFRNFPPLDNLIYHENGWTLHKAIKNHYDAYNRWRIKKNLINSLLNITATEIRRLQRTAFDELVRKFQLYKYVTIYGEARCQDETLTKGNICRKHYDNYEIGVDEYLLPPYHQDFFYWNLKSRELVYVPGCQCEYVYYDDPDDINEDNSDYEDD